MYQITNWQDHVVERPRTYSEVDNGDGSKTYTPAPGEVLQQGTPMSATNFNKLEQGLLQNSALLDLLASYLAMKVGHSPHTLETLDAAKLGVNANALTASEAAKLTTARNIGITGKAVATAASFNGTSAVNINITALDVLSNADFLALSMLVNALQSITQMQLRDLTSRVEALEEAVAAI